MRTIAQSVETLAWFAVFCAGALAFGAALNVGAYVCGIMAGIVAGGAVCMVIVRA